MKLPLVLCLAALTCHGIQAHSYHHNHHHQGGHHSPVAYPTEPTESGSMETNYSGKLHERDEHGNEQCVGSFSGSNVFRNHHKQGVGSWYVFSNRCKELVGGLMLMISNAVNNGCKHMVVDLDLRSRIVNPGHSCCEQGPVITRVTTDHEERPEVMTPVVVTAEPEPVHVQEIPVHVQEVPVHVQEVPVHVQEVPVRVQEVPVHVQEVPVHVQEVPVRVQEVPVRVQEVPVRVQEVPVRVQEVPVRVPVTVQPVTIQPTHTEIVKEIEIPVEDEYEPHHKHHEREHHPHHKPHHSRHHPKHHGHDHHRERNDDDYYPHRHVKEYIRETQ